ncbi:MAG: S1C family serine protease, partial [Chloroflexota bacterium]|nr:S1C family serine protease [Chloroflexota bacterium]
MFFDKWFGLPRVVVAGTLACVGLSACSPTDRQAAQTAPEPSVATVVSQAQLMPLTLETVSQEVAPAAMQTTALPTPAVAADTAQAETEEERVIADVYTRVAPAVVAITPGGGLGSGFLIDREGHIVTNNHVVAGSRNGEVLVSFSGLFETIGEVVGTD